MGGGSVVVWAAFSLSGKTDISILHGKQNAKSYYVVLDHYLHSLMHVFLQLLTFFILTGNAPFYTGKTWKDWFRSSFTRLRN